MRWLMRRSQERGREADQDIDEPLSLRLASEEFIHDVPVVAHEAPETDEAPVQATDEDQDVRGPREACLRFLIHEERGIVFQTSKQTYWKN